MTIHVAPRDEKHGEPTLEAAVVAPSEQVRGSRSAWIGFAAVLILAVLVFWCFDALPFQDLPAHAGLIAMRHRFATSPFEQQFYVLAPHIGPYSLFRFIGEEACRIASPVAAVRFLATLPAIATPLALLFARRRLHDDRSPTFGFLGIALSFGIMTLLGFASYLLGVAFMLLGVTLWLDMLARLEEPNARRRELGIAILAPLLFIAHGHAFLLFLLCAALSTLTGGKRLERIVRLRALIPALLVAAWAFYLEQSAASPPGSVLPKAHALVPRFQGPADKLGLLLSGTLMTRTGIDFAIGFLLLALTVACSVVTVRSLGWLPRPKVSPPTSAQNDLASSTHSAAHSRALYCCAAVILVVFLVLPHSVGWFGFVDGRLVPVAMMLALLGIHQQTLPRFLSFGLQYGSRAFAAAIATVAMVASYRFQDEAKGYREVLAHVEPESRLLNLPIDPNSDVFTVHPFVHYDKLVLVDRPIVVSDVWFHQGSALYPTPKNPALRLPSSYSESNLKRIDWPAYHLEDWDYVLIRTRPNAPEPSVPDALKLEAHQGGWWLYQRGRT